MKNIKSLQRIGSDLRDFFILFRDDSLTRGPSNIRRFTYEKSATNIRDWSLAYSFIFIIVRKIPSLFSPTGSVWFGQPVVRRKSSGRWSRYFFLYVGASLYNRPLPCIPSPEICVSYSIDGIHRSSSQALGTALFFFLMKYTAKSRMRDTMLHF